MPNSAPDLTVSLSAIQAFRRCQQQYFYRYIARLKRRDRALAPELGTMLHKYCAIYLAWLQADMSADDAHTTALMDITKHYLPEIRRYVSKAREVGQHELADELDELPKVAGRIATSYYNHRGRFDAERYEVLFVEERIAMDITSHIRSVSIVDAVLRDRGNGLVSLWEHKSAKDTPSDGYRMRDLQTALYAAKLKTLGMCDIDLILWNYIRSVEPRVPEVLKSGKALSQAAIDSTWEVYAAEVTRHGFLLSDYEKMREALEGRELSVFFQRYEHPLVSTDLLLKDYITTAKDIRRHVKGWRDGVVEPVRNLARDCDFFCEFKALCNAAVIGGDESDVIELMFVKD